MLITSYNKACLYLNEDTILIKLIYKYLSVVEDLVPYRLGSFNLELGFHAVIALEVIALSFFEL